MERDRMTDTETKRRPKHEAPPKHRKIAAPEKPAGTPKPGNTHRSGETQKRPEAPERKKAGRTAAVPETAETQETETAERRGKSRKRRRNRRGDAVRSILRTLIVVAAAAVLFSHLLMPVLHIYGKSMNSTLNEGDIVLVWKGGRIDHGDIIGFNYSNQILVKRVIGVSGDWIDMDQDGTVYVNSQKLEEPYLETKSMGECNIKLPYQVPESRLFVMGDNRGVSVDSRNTAVGCVSEEQILGKVVFRFWPLSRFGPVR